MGRAGVHVLIDRNVGVEARDGVALATDVYRLDGEPRACLLQRVPYGKDNPAIVNGAIDVLRAVERGYAVVVQDCRGRGRSGGRFDPFADEADDGEATIDWIVAQPWYAGSIGTFGRSYSGMTQWLLAARGRPEIKAIAPMFSGHDVNRGWFVPGGVVEWGFLTYWAGRYLAPDTMPIGLWDGDAFDSIGGVVHEALADALPALQPYLSWRAPDSDVAGSPALPPAVPSLVVAGWFDLFLRGCLETYRALVDQQTPVSLVVGPWPHGGSNSGVFPERTFGSRASADAVDLTEIHLAWFDRWLRGAEPERASVRVFTMGRNSWSVEPSWPPVATEVQRYYLAGAGSLAPHPGDEARTEIVYDESDPVPTIGGATFLPGLEVAANAGPRDQRVLLGRADVVTFASDAFMAPSTLRGELRVCLYVDSEAGLRFCVRLVDVAPSGEHWLIAEAAGNATTEGLLEIALGATSYDIAVDHRLAVMVSNSSYPRFHRSVLPGTSTRPRKGRAFVLHGPKFPSCIALEAMTVDERIGET